MRIALPQAAKQEGNKKPPCPEERNDVERVKKTLKNMPVDYNTPCTQGGDGPQAGCGRVVKYNIRLDSNWSRKTDIEGWPGHCSEATFLVLNEEAELGYLYTFPTSLTMEDMWEDILRDDGIVNGTYYRCEYVYDGSLHPDTGCWTVVGDDETLGSAASSHP